MLDTVKVPLQFEPLFEKAQKYVQKYFNLKKEDPSHGTIDIFGQRYILVRAGSMSVDFFDTIQNIFKESSKKEASDFTRSLLYDFAHTIGKMDARNFHKKLDIEDPIEKLSTGPVHFSHSGWAFVDIFPESKPSPDENFYLIYDHPFSFEADAWEKSGEKPDFPVCVMNAGYSSGWCEESFGVPLVASEIMCKARGDKACRFIMAHPSKIEQYISEYIKQEPDIASQTQNYKISGFFDNKRTEEALRKSEERFRQVTENAMEWFWEVDSNGLYTYSNPVIEQLLGYKPDKIVGKKYFFDLFSEDNHEKLKADALKAFAQKKNFNSFINSLVHKNGQIVWVSTNGMPMLDEKDNLIGYRGSDINITQQKQNEAKLKQLNSVLEETVNKLERTNTELKNFVYIASHDLREPLRKITAFGSMLKQSLSAKITDTDDKESLDFMIDGANRMQQMIEALLTYSRVTTKDVDFENINLNDAIEQLKTLELAVNLEETGGKILVPEQLPTIKGDPAQVRQLLQNLISNALKYQKKDTLPETIIRAYQQDDGMARIEVEDNGIGIKREQCENVFVMFRRLHSRQEYDGTGIGLAICKKIVERHGGNIGVNSTYGEGSTFWFTIPAAESHEKQSAMDLSSAKT